MSLEGQFRPLFKERRTNKDEEKEQDAELEEIDQKGRHVLEGICELVDVVSSFPAQRADGLVEVYSFHAFGILILTVLLLLDQTDRLEDFTKTYCCFLFCLPGQ